VVTTLPKRPGSPFDVRVDLVRLRPRERRDEADAETHRRQCRCGYPSPYNRRVADVEIKVRANGPYKVTGPVRIFDAEGNEFALPEGDSIVLCRCGSSANKPFCDKSHREACFVADDAAPRVSY